MIIKLDTKPKKAHYPAIFLGYFKWLAFLCLVATTLFAVFIDRPLCQLINNEGTPFDSLASLLSSTIKPIHFLVYVPFFFLLNKLLWKSEKINQSFFALQLILPTIYVICSIISSLIPRASPESFLASGTFGISWMPHGASQASFPSVAAAMTGALFSLMSYHSPKRSWHLFFIGYLISISDVLALKSFLSDATFGYFLGLFLGQWIFVKMKSKKITP